MLFYNGDFVHSEISYIQHKNGTHFERGKGMNVHWTCALIHC